MPISAVKAASVTATLQVNLPSNSTAGSDFAHLLTPLQNKVSAGLVDTASSAAFGATTNVSAPAQDPAVSAFMNYVNESPAQQFEDSWLAAHGLTRKDLKNMSPEKREAILKEIAQEMKAKIEDETQKKVAVAS